MTNCKIRQILAALLLAIMTTACGNEDIHNGKTPIARVFDSYLYYEDLGDLVPKGASPEDSTSLVLQYTNVWVKQQLMIKKAELNLTPEQREEIWLALATNYEPQNRQYLYNFVFDNCATRPYHLIANALQDSIVSDYTGHTGVTYRAFIRQYTGALSMENAGITLLFGPKADQPMNSEQRLFLPEELMLFMESAHLSDGTPIVSEGSVQPFPAPVVPWYATWPFWLAVYFAFVFGMSLTDLRRHRWSKWVEIAAAIPYLLLLLIVGFLTFFSCHPLVGFGWRLLIIPFTHLCARLIYIIRR